MSLVICDYLINMAFLILAMEHCLQKLCLLVVIVLCTVSRKEAIGVLLLVCLLPHIQIFLKIYVKFAKQGSNGENLEGCDFHLEVQ